MLNRPGAGPARVVLDTNVLLSLWVFVDSRFAPLRQWVESGAWLAIGDEPCLAEFRRVLGYPQFRLTAARQQEIFSDYCRVVIRIVEMPAHRAPLPRCSDRDDQKFLELARDGHAHLLVTSDRALLKLRGRARNTGLFTIETPDALLRRALSGGGRLVAPIAAGNNGEAIQPALQRSVEQRQLALGGQAN